MATLADVKKGYGDAVEALIPLADAGGEAYDAQKAVVDGLGKQLQRLEEVEELKALSAKPLKMTQATGTGGEAGEHKVYAEAAAPKIKGQNVARLMLSLAASKGNAGMAADFAQKQWGSSGDAVVKNLLASVGSAGGFLVPDDMREELIELLRPASVIFSSGPRIIQMPRGNLGIPGLASGASAGYVGEAQPIAPSTQTFNGISLVAKKLAALVPISNDMIRYPNMSTDLFVRDDMISSMATVTDQALLRGLGTMFSPKGLRGWVQDVLASNFFTANTTINVVNVTSDLVKLELAMANANIPQVSPVWIMSPRSKAFLGNLRDANSNFVFPEVSGVVSMLRGKPIKTTTSVPDNIGGTSLGSEIYLTEFSQFIVGESIGLEFAAVEGAAFWDGSATVSAFSQDQTVMRALTAHDSAMRQPRAVTMLDDVRWIP